MAKKVILTILLVKLAIFLLIIFAYFLLPFAVNYYSANFSYPPHQSITLLTAFKTWDGQHYVYLAEHGYKANDISNAFAPLFPFTIYLVDFLTKNSFVSGLLLSNIFSIIGLYLFFILIKNTYSEKIAWRSLLFVLAFPTSFYFSLIYTESLFFLLLVLFFLLLQRRKLFLTSLTALLLPMTRLIGIAIIIPFIFSYILEYHGHSLHDELTAIRKSLFTQQTLFLLSPLLGLFAVMCAFYIMTGSFLTQFSAQQNFISQYSFFSIFNPRIFLHTLFTFPLVLHGYTNSLLDRIFFLFFVLLLFFLYKRVTKIFFIYAVCFGLLPVLSGSFMSYVRYLLIVFPIFIGLGKMSLEKKYSPFVFPFLYASMMLQTLFLIMHSLNYWVA